MNVLVENWPGLILPGLAFLSYWLGRWAQSRRPVGRTVALTCRACGETFMGRHCSPTADTEGSEGE